MNPRRLALVALFTSLAFSPGCFLLKSSLGVKRVGYAEVYDQLTANAINSDGVSIGTQEILHLLDLDDEFEQDPALALELLHRRAEIISGARILFALSEIAYAIGEETSDRRYFLASSVYAYFCLLGEGTTPPTAFDRRFRIACDLYNRGLANCVDLRDDTPVQYRAKVEVDLPVGSITLDIVRTGFPWGDKAFDRFLPADAYEVKGLSMRVRHEGLGLPLIAIPSDEDLALFRHTPPNLKIPATAFMRLDGGLADMEQGLHGTVELHPAYDTVQVAEQAIPLETDVTAPLAFMLGERDTARLGIRRFFKDDSDNPPGIFMLEPYQPGKIPVVFVHGTASSPATWSEMFNTLGADALLREKFQFWFFTYTTGNPVLYSAERLRTALDDLVKDLDPQGADPALRDMILLGHSQGGMLVRLQVTDGTDLFWNAMDLPPIEELELDEESEQLMRSCLVFERSPYPSRVVFLSTPHNGSFVAGNWIGRFLKKRVSQARNLTKAVTEVFSSEKFPKELRENMPTSVDNMTPDTHFVQTLSSAPIEGPYHSIIAVKSEEGEPFEKGNDGVVEYTSAHLEGAESELVVDSGHSVQDRARAIIEVRRILYAHLGLQPRHKLSPEHVE